MKTVFAVFLLAFAITLAIIVGSRLPVDAMGVIVGVVCGVLASIPTSLLILAVANRRDNRYDNRYDHALQPAQSYPPVVVVNAPPGVAHGGQPWPAQMAPWPVGAPAAAPRQFRIIGQDAGTGGDNRYFD